MAGFGEPWEWTTDRNQRMESEYPELADTSADDVLGTDNYAVSQGRAPTQFSSTAMGLGAHSVVSKETEDNSWWGAIKRAGSSILALDTPISERLGYKVPEGSGPADEFANFALEEATRPSNIAFSAIGAVLSASGIGAPVGAPILVGTAARITAGATTRAAARGAAKNIAIGVGGRVAATGVEKAAEYAPEEINPLAGLASAGAGLYATRGRSGLTRGAAALAAGGIGYASPELAGGIAGGVLTHKAIGGFSSWKEAANSIENRAATQAETQAAQLLEQAEASKQRMRDLAAAERRGETRIASDQMPETPMGQEFENNLLGEVAYKTSGDDAIDRAALRKKADVDPEEAARANRIQRRQLADAGAYEDFLTPEDVARNTRMEGLTERINALAALKKAPLGPRSRNPQPGIYLSAGDGSTHLIGPFDSKRQAEVYDGLVHNVSIQYISFKSPHRGAERLNTYSADDIVSALKSDLVDRRQFFKPNNQVLIDARDWDIREERLNQFTSSRRAFWDAEDAAAAAEAAAARMPVLAKYEAALRANKSGPLSPLERTVRFSDMQPADAVEAIRQEIPSSGQVINAANSQRASKNLMGIDERGEVYLTSKGGGILSKWDDATKKFVRRPVVKFDPNAYQPRITWKVGIEFPATALDETGAQVAAQAKAAAPAAPKLNYQDIPKVAKPDSFEYIFSVAPLPATVRPSATSRPFDVYQDAMERASAARAAEPAGRIVEPVPDVNPHLAKMRTKPGEPGYAKALQRAESRWKAQQTIRAAAAPVVEPPIARVETPAAQQVDTPVTPAAGGGGEVPPPPRETATGGAPEFKGTPQSSRSFPTWEDSATHNRISAELAPVIEERLGQAAKTTALKTSENNKIKDIANRQAEKVREAAISEGKTESQANALYREEWRKAYSGERTKSKLDLPLTISDLTDAQIRDSFTRVQREVPGDTYLINKIFEATRALDAITGKTQGAKKSELESLKFWVNLMSPEEESRYLENQFRNYGGFNSKNAKLLVTQEKLLKAKPAFGADDIADGVPAGSAGRGAADEAAAPRQTGERTASTTGEPTAPRETIILANDTSIGVNDAGDPLFQRADGSVYRMRSDSPTTRPNGYPDFGGDLAPATNAAPSPGAARAEAAAALPDAEATGATGEGGGATGGGGKGRGKGAGKGGGDEGGGASSTGDDIEGVPEANDYGKSFRKSEQEIKEARGVNTFWNILTDVLAAPRSLKASFDLSGAGRQAAPYGYSHPGQALKAFKAQLKAYGSEAGYQESVERLANKPWADIRNEVVANSLVDQPLLNGERTFISKGLNKVPGFRASERAYATYLNELRDSAFEMMWRNSGLSLEELTSVANVPKVKAWGDLINAATGHGDIGTLFNAKVAGNPILWAPNFLYSRVKLPWIALTQWHQNPEVAFEAAKQLGIFVGVNSALLAGVNASGAASVELDPRSSDFGQMRIGNSRIDPWAGYRPIVNLVARLQSGETKSTTTGDISDPTNLKIVQDFLRNKMEPLSGEFLNWILGSNSIGEPTVADTNMAIRLVAPLFLESMVRAINVGGPSVTPSENFSDQIASFGRNVTSPGGLKAAALTLPGVLGVGTATYEPLIKKMDRATLDRMSPQERNNFRIQERRGLANLTPAEQQKAIPSLAFRQMYETMPSATRELSNYGSFSGFKRDKIREYTEYYMDIGVSKANAVLRAEQKFQNSAYQNVYQKHVKYLKYQWSQANPGVLAEEIEETYKINPRDRTFRPNAMQKAMAEPYLQKR